MPAKGDAEGGSRSYRGNRRVPRSAKQDQRPSGAAPEGLAELRSKTKAKAKRSLPACGARGETNAAPQARRAGSPSCGARPPGLAKPAGRQAADGWGRLLEGAGSTPERRQTAGLPECRRETRRGLGIGRLEAEGSRRAMQDKGRRPRAGGAGPAAQKTAGVFLLWHLTIGKSHIKALAVNFCAAGSGIFIPPPAPRRLAEPRRSPEGFGAKKIHELCNIPARISVLNNKTPAYETNVSYAFGRLDRIRLCYGKI